MRAKLRTCHSVWHAYRNAYVRYHYLIAHREGKMTAEEKLACKSYDDVIKYERNRNYAYFKDKDHINYRRAYCDALRLYNRINAIEDKKDVNSAYNSLDKDEKSLMDGFRYLITFACDKRQRCGNFDHKKVLEFSKRLDEATDYKKRKKKK